MEKSPRNKTLTLDESEQTEYLARALEPRSPLTLEAVLGRTIHADCLAAMPLLPRGFVELLIADPPYNLRKDYDGGVFERRSDEDYRAFTDAWLDAALPLLAKNASVYVCCDWRSSDIVRAALEKRLTVLNRITWQREKGRGAQSNWKNGMEDIWFAVNGRDYVFDLERVRVRRRVVAPYTENGEPKDWTRSENGGFRDTCPSNFWDDITVPYWSMSENTEHPTQKPEKLIAKLILASSREGGVVFDPFLGSGTTSVTAKKLGRGFVGIESSARYCAIAEKRLAAAQLGGRIQGFEDGIFYERNARLR